MGVEGAGHQTHPTPLDFFGRLGKLWYSAFMDDQQKSIKAEQILEKRKAAAAAADAAVKAMVAARALAQKKDEEEYGARMASLVASRKQADDDFKMGSVLRAEALASRIKRHTAEIEQLKLRLEEEKAFKEELAAAAHASADERRASNIERELIGFANRTAARKAADAADDKRIDRHCAAIEKAAEEWSRYYSE